LLVTAIVLALASGSALWIVTRSWFIVARVEPIFERRLGGDVSIAMASYEGDGIFVLDGIELRTPDLPGTGGEIGTIDRARVEVDMDALFSGAIRVRRVEVNRLFLRASEDEHDPGRFNFMMLRPQGEVGQAGVVPPRVQINRAVVEVGRHGAGGAYEARGTRVFSGSLRPEVGADDWYRLRFVELGEGGDVRSRGVVLDGRWNAATRETTFLVTGMELDRRTYDVCPQLVQIWWDRMELNGRVSEVRSRLVPDGGFAVELDVEDVSLTLPIENEDFWARYQGGEIVATSGRPRMHVRDGTIRLGETSVELADLEGELKSTTQDPGTIGVPYRVHMSIDDIPPLDWSDKVRWMVSRAPGSPPPAVELPLVVARVLEKFHFSDWSLSTVIEISRGAPQAGADGALAPAPILSSGEAFIADAAGRYQRFPYPLEDVTARLHYDNDRIVIHGLSGRGATGAHVTLEGTITPPGNAAAVDLRLRARGVPVDEHLRGALGPAQRRAFDAMLSRSAHDALRTAGHPGAGEDGAGPGGLIDLELAITRAAGADSPTVTTGIIDVHRLDLLAAEFPYPITALGGRLEWKADRVTIDDGDGGGIPITTAGGGRGLLNGEIVFGADGVVRPDVALRVAGDRVTPMLLAAIPPDDDGAAESAGGRLSPAARWLGEMKVEGALRYEVRLTRPGAATEYAVDLALDDGRLDAAPLVAQLLGADGPMSDGAWRLDDCTARARARNGVITIDSMTARRGDDRVEVRGEIGMGSAGALLDVTIALRDVAIAPHWLDLLPAPSREQARAAWDRLQPDGTFHADLVCRRSGAEPETIDFSIVPAQIRVVAAGALVTVRAERGRIRLVNDAILLEDLSLVVSEDGGPDAHVALAGTLPAPGGSAMPLRVEGALTDGTLGSALVAALLESASEAVRRRWVELEPQGDVDARFTVERGAGLAETTYRVELAPRNLAIRLRDTPIDLDLDPGALFVLAPDRIDVVRCAGTNVAGRFTASGTIDFAPRVEANLAIAYEGRVMSEPMAALLPDANRLFESIALHEGGPTVVRDGRLRIVESAAVPGAHEVRFDGRVDVEDATFDAGAAFKAVTGALVVSVETASSRPPAVRLHALPIALELYGQKLIGGEIDLVLDETGRRVRLEKFAARGEDGGRVTAEGEIGIGADDHYRLDVRVAGLALESLRLGPPKESGDGGADGEAAGEDRATAGRVFASIDLAGRRGMKQTRIGRGVARIVGERLADVPLVLQLLQVFYVTLPGATWDFADATFYVEGGRMIFERIKLESTILGDRSGVVAQELVGAGEMDLETLEINARFSSRGGLIGVRDVIGGIGDQIAAIEVTGPIWDPKARLVSP
jgi:hypothetical protein